MVVCKCRKATKLYCFVHKVPVCGECICFSEHQICVVRTYSEWVIDGEYEWPPKCSSCNSPLDEGSTSATTRLGCLHLIHTDCLVSHIKSLPSHTAPAGYTCPTCSVPIWPPKTVKDSASSLHSNLKEAILKSGLEKNLFGNHPVSMPAPPPAFASDPLVTIPSSSSTITDVSEIVKIDSSSSPTDYIKSSSSTPGTTTRKGASYVDKQSSEISYYADDEDGNHKKYTRRGPFRHKLLRALLPFWSTSLPTLPVTAPENKPRHQKSSRVDPRKILLIIAIMACMATMGILYYRIAQRGLEDNLDGQ